MEPAVGRSRPAAQHGPRDGPGGEPDRPADTKIDSISHWITRGENVCQDLDEFKAIADDLVEHRKMTEAQATTLKAAADAIKANSPTPC